MNSSSTQSKTNPFIEQILLQYFVGREHQLENFHSDLDGLKKGESNHHYIAGKHGAGKTYYLAKLVDIAMNKGFLAVQVSLDDKVGSQTQIFTILETAIYSMSEIIGNSNLFDDWSLGASSKHFVYPRKTELNSESLKRDFIKITKILRDASVPGLVICIDEGQRIEGRALSALKNALQHIPNVLIILSIRLISGFDNAVNAGREFLDTKVSSDGEADMGASRFYVKGVAIGAFDTDLEAAKCLQLRLSNNIIEFDNEVIEKIVRISGRMPKDIIRFSNVIYDLAQQNSKFTVDLSVLNVAFRDHYKKELGEVSNLLAESLESAKFILNGLLKADGAATAEIICNQLYGSEPYNYRDRLVVNIEKDLDKLCNVSTICKKNGDAFEIANPVHAYALELLIGNV